MIGGAEKYMAVCRTCYQIPGKHNHFGSTPIRGAEITTGRQLFDLQDSLIDY